MSTSRDSTCDKLLQHLKNCPIISGSISIGKRHVSCKGCRVTKTFDSQGRNFVRSLIRHSELDCHKLYCHWTLKRNYKSTSGFKTIRIGQSLVNDQITNFYQSSKNPDVTGDDHETEEEPSDDSDVSFDLPAAEDLMVPIVSKEKVETTTQTDYVQYSDAATSCLEQPSSFENDLKLFLQSLGFDLSKRFTLEDVRRYYDQHPIAKNFTENGFRRDVAQSRHSQVVKDFVISQGLKHSLSSTLEWSSAFGGPKKSIVRAACRAQVKILPYLDEKNLDQHFEIFVHKVLVRHHNISIDNVASVPLQASFDATATTGRLYTRKSGIEGTRILYGLTASHPNQKTFLLNDIEDEDVKVSETREELLVYGMENVRSLEDSGKIGRASSYMSVVILPLISNARPYCIGMFAINKGSDTDTLSIAHNMVIAAAARAGMRIVTLPGDGDTVLRSLQWSLYQSHRGWRWLTELLLPCYLLYDSNGDSFRFPMQDMLHNLKKGNHHANFARDFSNQMKIS